MRDQRLLRQPHQLARLVGVPRRPVADHHNIRAHRPVAGRARGLEALETDAEGNVMGLRRGIGNGPLICVAARLDTVFPRGTDVTVRREGT